MLGPGGSFSYINTDDIHPLVGEEFPLLPLATIRELRLKCRGSWVPPEFRLSSFPSLEILVVDGHDVGDCFTNGGGSIPNTPAVPSLSSVLPNPASPPSLKTLAFLDCVITEDFMVKLARVALDRKNYASNSLRRVVIMNSKGRFLLPVQLSGLGSTCPPLRFWKGRNFQRTCCEVIRFGGVVYICRNFVSLLTTQIYRFRTHGHQQLSILSVATLASWPRVDRSDVLPKGRCNGMSDAGA